MDSLLSRHWHHLPCDEIESLLETDSEKGLDTFAVAHRQAHFGPNRLTLKKGHSPLVLFLLQLNQPLVYILLVAAAITFLLQEWVDSGVIFGVVLVNAVVGFIQESRAVKAIEALAQSMEGTATVVRAGRKTRIQSAEVVPGDLVLLQSGDKVPADLRLLRTRELQIDESALTGESIAARKQPEQLVPETVLADRTNIAYSSTLVTYGTGAGLVVATGDGADTEDHTVQRNPSVDHSGACRPDRAGGLAARQFTARYLHGRRSTGRWRDTRGPACGDDHHAGDRRGQDGPASRHHPPDAGRRNPGQHDGHLLRQDRHTDAEPDDGAGGLCGRRLL